jgi:hypothetical protein
MWSAQDPVTVFGADRVYIHQLPQTAPRGGRADRGRVRPSSAGWAGGIGVASGGGNPTRNPDLIGLPMTALLLVRADVAGTGFEPV